MLASVRTLTIRLRILSQAVFTLILVAGIAKLPAQNLAPVVTPDDAEEVQDFNALQGSDLLDLVSTENSSKHASKHGKSGKSKGCNLCRVVD
jgi:hypothetical protein